MTTDPEDDVTTATTEPDGPSEPVAPDEAATAAAALRRAAGSTAPRRAPRPRTTRPAFSDDRDPQPLGAAVEHLVRDQGWQQRTAVALVMAEWADIVGPELADHVRPESFDAGELTLRAESTTWATQVRLLLPQLRQALEGRVGSGTVSNIRIVGPQAPSWSAGPRRVKGRGPRDTYG